MRRLERAVEVLAASGADPRLIPTTGPRTAAGLAREAAASGAAAVLAAGGDGTINEVAEGLIGLDTPFGILPCGTANVLANEVRLPSDPLRAAQALGDCVPVRVGVGRIASGAGARHFVLMAGAGLDARIVYNVSAPLKAKLGKIAYWIGGFSLLGKTLEEFDVLVDGVRHRASFALVSRVRNYGGDLEIACSTTLLDESFEVVLFEGAESRRYLKYFTAVALRRVRGVKGVTLLRARTVEFPHATATAIHTQVDGEYSGRLPATVEFVPDALTLLLPKAYVERCRAAR